MPLFKTETSAPIAAKARRYEMGEFQDDALWVLCGTSVGFLFPPDLMYVLPMETEGNILN